MTQDTPAALPAKHWEWARIEARIQALQAATAYPESVSVAQAMKQLVNELWQEYGRETSTQAATSAAGGATGEQSLPQVPKGFEIYYLKGFDALFDALNRAVEKGYLPDAMTEEWEAFDCMGPVAALAAQSPDSGAGPAITEAMVDAYLKAQAAKVQEVDNMWGGKTGKAAEYLHPVRDACRAGLAAALAQQGAQNG